MSKNIPRQKRDVEQHQGWRKASQEVEHMLIWPVILHTRQYLTDTRKREKSAKLFLPFFCIANMLSDHVTRLHIC